MWRRFLNWLNGGPVQDRKFLYCYFISYFVPNKGFFNVMIQYPSKIRENKDVKALEYAVMDSLGIDPNNEEERAVIVNISYLDRLEVDPVE